MLLCLVVLVVCVCVGAVWVWVWVCVRVGVCCCVCGARVVLFVVCDVLVCMIVLLELAVFVLV